MSKTIPLRVISKLRTVLPDLPYYLQEFWIKKVSKRPFEYTDQFGLRSIIRPNENVFFYLKHRSHFDDLGMVRFLQNILSEGMTVFDVGANKGEFSLYAARLVAPGGQIHAFEPVQYALEFFEENLALYPEFTSIINVHKQAVSDSDGEVVMNLFPEEFSGWNSVGGGEMKYHKQTIRPTHKETVPCTTIETFCEQHRIPHIDLLKIDVEGFELEVAAGAKRLAQSGRIKCIIFEISLAPLVARNITPASVLTRFQELGYKVSQIMPDGTLGNITVATDFSFPYFANYVAEPR